VTERVVLATTSIVLVNVTAEAAVERELIRQTFVNQPWIRDRAQISDADL
jgi:hypothetical protein